MIRTLIHTLLLAAVAMLPATSDAVSFDWAHIGNAGNAYDLETGYGAVSYNYAISKTEVTNAQYAEFLNAVAVTDNFGGADPTLYDTNMGSNSRGGISRSGSAGSFTYTVKMGFADKPVNYISFFDAMRFTNWLHNGQGNGGTETGAYEIGNGSHEVRSSIARYWIPSSNEWYKAAYHDANAGTAGVYFDYATSSNDVPTVATANSLGDINNPDLGVVNYNFGADWNGPNGNVTTVGSAGISSGSPYGTFDQNGNVWEWNDTVLSFSGTDRSLRGGSFGDVSIALRSNHPIYLGPTIGLDGFNDVFIGFRVATVPEPSTVLMGTLAASGLLMRRRGHPLYPERGWVR